MRVAVGTESLELLDGARELGVGALECGLGHLLEPPADERHLHQELHDRPQVAPAAKMNIPALTEAPKTSQEPGSRSVIRPWP